MIEVVLPWDLVWRATRIGACRRIVSLQQGLANKYGYQGNPWDDDIISANSECATGYGLKRRWLEGINTYKAPDVEDNIQVRWTAKESNRLIVRPQDHDDHRYVLVTGQIPYFKLWGYMYGSEVKGHDEWRYAANNRPPAWFVDKDNLRDIEELVQ